MQAFYQYRNCPQVTSISRLFVFESTLPSPLSRLSPYSYPWHPLYQKQIEQKDSEQPHLSSRFVISDGEKFCLLLLVAFFHFSQSIRVLFFLLVRMKR